VALSDIEALLARRRRHVELRVDGDPPNLQGVPGVSHVRVHDGVVTWQLEGDAGPFLAAISGLPVRDLSIEPARLEDAFLEFYENDGAEGVSSPGEAKP
jgi:hypothetical protein